MVTDMAACVTPTLRPPFTLPIALGTRKLTVRILALFGTGAVYPHMLSVASCFCEKWKNWFHFFKLKHATLWD